jgi:hypothetical protein
MQQLIDGYIQKKENKMGLGATKGTSKAGNSARLKEVEEDTSIAGPLGWDVEEDSGDVVEYRRQWRMVSMRWKIYENEEKDYRIDVAALASKFVIHRYTHTHTHTHTHYTQGPREAPFRMTKYSIRLQSGLRGGCGRKFGKRSFARRRNLRSAAARRRNNR